MLGIIVHGGAGTWREEDLPAASEGLRRAASAGFEVLVRGRSALDACQTAIMVLEDDPGFNAGTGCVLNLEGVAELDAALMDGAGRAGAVGGLQRTKNPIAVARAVLERTDHVLLVGDGAQRFAFACGFPDVDPVTEHARSRWRRQSQELQSGGRPERARLQAFLHEHPEYQRGTVGCVVVDRQGIPAAGGSTGGVPLKLPGRIGDTPVLGAGLYASASGGACATGEGEDILRAVLSYCVVAMMDAGLPPQEAVKRALSEGSARPRAGMIALSVDGRVGFATNTRHIPVAYQLEEMAAPVFQA
jgi:beta-aspartyl-peptidase (threonine type)